MTAPTAYDRQISFAAFSAANPGVAHSGTSLDTEFNAVKVAMDETQANLALIVDNDGVLARGSVGLAQFDSSVTIGFAAPTPWAADTTYTVNTSTVFYQAVFYQCTATHVSSDTFDTTKWAAIADLSVGAALADGGVTEAKLADGAVTNVKIGSLAVSSAKLASNSVTTAKIADDNVTTAKIADANVTTAKIADAAVTSNKVDGSVWSTGDVKLTIKTAADAGWLMMNDGTIGDASSGATHANADAEDLFTLIFNNITDANAPVLTSAGGATTRAAQTNAAIAWAAHCRISLTKALGRALGVAGAGSGLTSRALGVVAGSETQVITQAQLPVATLNLTGTPGTVNVTSTTDNVKQGGTGAAAGSDIGLTYGSVTSSGTFTPAGTVPLGGSGQAHNNMQPTTFLNAMIKL